jgi:hypothetical protein
MESHLKSLLQSNGVHLDVINWLADPLTGCFTLKNFANWCDEAQQIQATILDHVQTQKTSRAQYASLKQAWKEAEAAVNRTLKRSAEGISEDHMDDPLSDVMQESVEKTFTSYYKFVVDPKSSLPTRSSGGSSVSSPGASRP